MLTEQEAVELRYQDQREARELYLAQVWQGYAELRGAREESGLPTDEIDQKMQRMEQLMGTGLRRSLSRCAVHLEVLRDAAARLASAAAPGSQARTAFEAMQARLQGRLQALVNRAFA